MGSEASRNKETDSGGGFPKKTLKRIGVLVVRRGTNVAEETLTMKKGKKQKAGVCYLGQESAQGKEHKNQMGGGSTSSAEPFTN